MSSRWVRSALCAVVVIAALPVLALPAAADGPDGYTSWTTHNQPDNGLTSAVGTLELTPDYGQFSAGGGLTDVRVGAPHGDERWLLEIRADGEALTAGHTYVGTESSPFGSVDNPVQVGLEGHDSCQPLNGWLKLHEIEPAPDGFSLGRFSATFSLRCTHKRGAITGSVAFHGSEPAQSVPDPLGGLSKDSIRGFRADFAIGMLTLHWNDPDSPSWIDTLVCSAIDKPLTKPWPWCTYESDGITAGEVMLGASPSGISMYTLFPEYTDGSLGPPATFTARGSIVTLETDPASAAAKTGLHLHGTLLDGPSRRPMPGRLVNVFQTRRWPDMNDSPDGGVREEKLVARLPTDARGNYGETFPLRPGWEYQARFDGNGVRVGNVAQLVPADGSSYIDLDAVRASTARSTRVRLKAKISSVHVGDKVLFQRMVKRHWRKVALRRVSKSGVAVTSIRITGRTGATFRGLLVPAGKGQRRASVPIRVQMS